MAKSNAQKCKEYRERRRAKLRAKKSPKKKTTTTTKDNPTSSTQRVKQFRLRKQRNTVNEIASHQLNLDSPNSFVKRNVELKPIPNVDLVDIKVKSEFINDFDNGCFESVNNECNGGQSSNNSGTGNYSNKIKEEHIEIEETIVKSEFNDRTYDEKCSIDNPIYSSTVNSEFSTKGNHTGHQSNLHCRNNFALVECNVDPKTVLDVDFDNIQVKSVFTNDFDNECFDSVNNEYNGGKSANLCDAGNDNIDIKDEHDIEITETIVKTEFNVSDCTYDEKCTIDNPNDSLISEIKFEEDSTLQNVNVKSKQKRHICSMCEYAFEKPYQLKMHMRTHTGEKPFTCSFCDYAFTTPSQLKMHVRKHSGERPFQCTVCQFASAASAGLTSHMRLHTGQKPYKCDLCEYATVTSRNLKFHMHKHTGKKPYKCNLCDYACVTSSQLKSHMIRHTGEMPYTCEVCDYACARPRQLKLHIRTHTGLKRHTCSMCEYAAITLTKLKLHMLVHTEKTETELHKRGLCEYASGTSRKLTMHKHAGKKPYKCDQCDYACPTSSQLKSHMTRHTRERPYQCAMCDYTCARRGQLKLHIRIHTRLKPYHCSRCPYSTITSNKLKLHMRIHTQEKKM